MTTSEPPLSSNVEDPVSESFPNAATTNIRHSFHQKWSRVLQADSTWDEFSSSYSAFATNCVTTAQTITSSQPRHPAPCRPDRPGARPHYPSRRHHHCDATEARRLQTLYCYFRKRAARKILQNNSPMYTGTISKGHTFFANIFNHKPCDTTKLIQELPVHVPTAEPEDPLFDPPSAEEIQQKLTTMGNSAPGQDHVEHRHLRLLDKKFELPALIF